MSDEIDEKRIKHINKRLDENQEHYIKFLNSPFSDESDEKGYRVIYCIPPPSLFSAYMNAYYEEIEERKMNEEMDINPNDAEQTQLAFRNMGLYDN